MKKHLKILLATDYSEAVKSAEHYAIELAKSTPSTLTFLHVCEFPLSQTTARTSTYINAHKEWFDREKKRLEQHKNNLLELLKINSHNFPFDCIVSEGTVSKQVKQEAENINADLIIVGTYGITGFRELLFGTHAWEIIKKSAVPVIAVPKDALFTGIRNIVFGTEYREGEIPVINFLTEFAARFDASITVLHITNYVLSKDIERILFENFRKEMKKNSYPKLNLQIAYSDDVINGLNDFCERFKASMLVMSPERKLSFEKIFLPSNTRKMSFHNRIPLMTIPDFYNPLYSAFWKLFVHRDYVNEDF